MPDIDSIISGVGGNTRADFSALGDPVKAFFDASKERSDFDTRRLFKDGVPTTSDGQPDFAAMGKALFQKGAFDQGVTASNLDLSRQQLKFGQGQSQDIQRVEGGAPPQQSNLVSPPSLNRSAPVAVAPALAKGGAAPPQDGQPQQPQGGATLMQVLQAQGIPNDQIGAASASIARQMGLQDPNAPINLQDPQVRNVLVPAIQQLKQMGIGQVQQPQGATQQAPGPPQQQPQVAQAPPQMAPQPQQVPQQQPQAQPAPVTNAVTTTQGPAAPSRNDQVIAFYSGIMSDPRSPKANVDLAKTRLEALQQNNAFTPDQKNYSQAILEGYKGTMQDYMAETEARKTAATEEAKLNATKYQTIVDNGTKAQQEIPQLQMLQKQMDDPNFFSGAGEKYNLLYKRLKSAVGIDPDAPVPQEFLRKATAANVLSSLGALKGLGQIRVAEINMAREAAASPDNSVPANKLLTEISLRTHQRNSDIADLAQDYKEKNGSLDAGFDKIVTKYGRTHPLFSDSEIKDWGTVIGRAAKDQPAQPGAPAKMQTFATPAAVHAANLPKGTQFLDANGVTRIVP